MEENVTFAWLGLDKVLNWPRLCGSGAAMLQGGENNILIHFGKTSSELKLTNFQENAWDNQFET
jgi:hypothetical protein